MIGEIVGSYRIVAAINEGGMGIVYQAEHTLIGRPAAVKVLLPQLSQNRDIVARFFNEAKVTSAIRHPGIVEIFDFGFHSSGRAYLVMELLTGHPLSAHLTGGRRLDEATAASTVRAIASALAAAHDAGVVHRDLKPDNIFLVPDFDSGGWRPKILDFGIAKLAMADQQANVKTRTGSVIGTPTYMSPEQCRGTGDLDARADLYSLGCILYEMVAGRPPFVSDGAGEIIGMHLHVAPETPRRWTPQLSAPMEALILSLLAKRPDGRPASAAALIAALDQMFGRPATLTSPGLAPSPFGAETVITPLPVMSTPPPMPRAPTTPTTLGGTASELRDAVPAPKRRWPLAVGAAVVAAAIGAVIAISMHGGGDAPKPAAAAVVPAPAADPAPAAAPAAVAVAVPAPVPVAAPVPAPVPVAAPVPAVVAKPAPAPVAAPVTKPAKPANATAKKKHVAPRKKRTSVDPIETQL